MDKWIEHEIQKLIEEQTDYRHIALLESTKEFLQQLSERKEQLELEIDGNMWSPKNW